MWMLMKSVDMQKL